MMFLASRSMSIIKTAPMKKLAGIDLVLSCPATILLRCGITRPTHPIVPQMHTEEAVRSVEQRMMTPLVTLRFTPSAFASLSPRDRC